MGVFDLFETVAKSRYLNNGPELPRASLMEHFVDLLHPAISVCVKEI